VSAPLDAVLVEARGQAEHLGNALEVLTCALASADLLSARYAAATITELSDRIETALLGAERATRVLAGQNITTASRA
jgi:hypothetical protein